LSLIFGIILNFLIARNVDKQCEEDMKTKTFVCCHCKTQYFVMGTEWYSDICERCYDKLHEYTDDLAEYNKNHKVSSDYIAVCNKKY
jgi:hypothetical protein